MSDAIPGGTIPPNAFAHPFVVTRGIVDLQGRVSNHEIVRLFVELASRHSTALGWGLDAYRELGAWWVVRRHEIDYLAGANEGDALIGYTWPSGLRKLKAARKSVILRPTDGAVIARALNTWTLIDIETNRPRRLPPAILETFDPAKWQLPPA